MKEIIKISDYKNVINGGRGQESPKECHFYLNDPLTSGVGNFFGPRAV